MYESLFQFFSSKHGDCCVLIPKDEDLFFHTTVSGDYYVGNNYTKINFFISNERKI